MSLWPTIFVAGEPERLETSKPTTQPGHPLAYKVTNVLKCIPPNIPSTILQLITTSVRAFLLLREKRWTCPNIKSLECYIKQTKNLKSRNWLLIQCICDSGWGLGNAYPQEFLCWGLVGTAGIPQGKPMAAQGLAVVPLCTGPSQTFSYSSSSPCQVRDVLSGVGTGVTVSSATFIPVSLLLPRISTECQWHLHIEWRWSASSLSIPPGTAFIPFPRI